MSLSLKAGLRLPSNCALYLARDSSSLSYWIILQLTYLVHYVFDSHAVWSRLFLPLNHLLPELWLLILRKIFDHATHLPLLDRIILMTEFFVPFELFFIFLLILLTLNQPFTYSVPWLQQTLESNLFTFLFWLFYHTFIYNYNYYFKIIVSNGSNARDRHWGLLQILWGGVQTRQTSPRTSPEEPQLLHILQPHAQREPGYYSTLVPRCCHSLHLDSHLQRFRWYPGQTIPSPWLRPYSLVYSDQPL